MTCFSPMEGDKDDGMYVVPCMGLHENMMPVLLESLHGHHESYSHEEMTSANNLSEHRS